VSIARAHTHYRVSWPPLGGVSAGWSKPKKREPQPAHTHCRAHGISCHRAAGSARTSSPGPTWSSRTWKACRSSCVGMMGILSRKEVRLVLGYLYCRERVPSTPSPLNYQRTAPWVDVLGRRSPLLPGRPLGLVSLCAQIWSIEHLWSPRRTSSGSRCSPGSTSLSALSKKVNHLNHQFYGVLCVVVPRSSLHGAAEPQRCRTAPVATGCSRPAACC